MASPDQHPSATAGGWRIRFGVALFVLSIMVPIAGVPLLGRFGVEGAKAASLTGGLLVAAEVIGLVAVAVLGKPGYAELKAKLGGFLRRHGPPDEVGPVRHRIGLTLFLLPVLLGWGAVYDSHHWIPGYTERPHVYAVGGDVLLLSSLFVLGGNFWDKIRALVVREAIATFPNGPAVTARTDKKD